MLLLSVCVFEYECVFVLLCGFVCDIVVFVFVVSHADDEEEVSVIVLAVQKSYAAVVGCSRLVVSMSWGRYCFVFLFWCLGVFVLVLVCFCFGVSVFLFLC